VFWSPDNTMAKFFALFIVIQLVLFTAELTPPAQEHFVVPFTEAIADISVRLVTLFDERVVAAGKVIRSLDNGFAVSIEAGCNGVEAMIVLAAAIFAFPAPWKRKIVGFVAGTLAIQLVNIVRIISLFYIGQWNLQVFEWAHLYIWQALIMLDVLVVFLIWLRTLPARNEPAKGQVSTGDP
jgi:exosortase H (IPTLxxWG-CTERM-specific)